MKYFLSILVIMFVVGRAFGQLNVSSYRFMQFQGTYTALTGGQSLGTSTSDDQLFNPDNLEGVLGSITGTGFPIGFPFFYEGATYSNFMVSNNGYIRLGNGTFTIRSNISGALQDSSATNGADFNQLICGLNADLQSQTGSALTINNVGNAPSRSCVIQYSNYRHYLATGESYNFQIWLNEADNSIEFKYGTFIKNDTDREYTVGIRGASHRFYNSRRVVSGEDVWASSRPTTNNGQKCAMLETLTPQSGQVYKWMPPVITSIDLSVSNIYFGSPGSSDCSFEDDETIKVDVTNFGDSAQSSAVVSYRLNSEAFITKTVTFNPPLERFQTSTVQFDGADAADLADLTSFSLTGAVFLSTEGDSTRFNDTISRNFQLNLRNLPVGPFNSFSTLTNASNGWRTGRGRFAPTFGTSDWATAFPFPVETIGLEVENTNNSLQDWLVSPKFNYDTSGTYVIRFNAALTADLFGSTAIESIEDDSIKVLYSLDCQATWRVLRSFTNEDLQAGRIDNTLKEFIFTVPRILGNNVSFAFFGYGNGTENQSGTYRFHINNLRVEQIFRKDFATARVAVPSIIHPSCGGSAQETVRVVVRNVGADPVSTALVGYKINALAPVTRNETFSPALLTGDSIVVLFTGAQGADMTAFSTYNVKGFCFQPGESVVAQLNDTASVSYNIVGPATLPSQVYPTFSSMTSGGWREGSGARSPSGTFSGWDASTDLTGGNPSTSIFISAFTQQIQDWIYSGAFNSGGSLGIRLKVGVAVGGGGPTTAANVNDDSLNVMVSTDCGNTWVLGKSFTRSSVTSGEIGNGRLLETSSILTNFVGNVRVALVLKSNNTFAPASYRWHIDDVQISPFASNDLGARRVFVQQLTSPNCPLSSQETVFVEVRNEGSVAQASSEVGYRLNNQPIVRQNITFSPGPLQPGESTIVSFSGQNAIDLSQAGAYTLRGYSFLQGETIVTRGNDSTAAVNVRIGSPYTLPYRQSFDSALVIPTGWTRDGTGFSKFRINSARGIQGTSSLSTNITNTNVQSFVTTPPFGPVQANHVLSMLYKLVNITNGSAVQLRRTDSLTVFVSTNCGQSFTVLAKIDSANFPRTAAFHSLRAPLAAYAGSNVTFRILARILGQTQAGCYVDIDNFTMESPTEMIKDDMKGFEVYPNPANEELNLVLPGAAQGNEKYLIINAMGVQVADGNLNSGTNLIPLKGLSAGMYVVKVLSKDGVHEKKIAVTR